MKYLIFGAGAIGSVFGGYLSKAGHDVWLVGRSGHMRAIKTGGLHIRGIWGEHTIPLPFAVSGVKDIPKNEEFDAILISVKSYDTKEAVREILPFSGEETLVVSLQNGIGNVEAMCEAVGKERCVGGRVIFGVEHHQPGEVEVTVYAEEVMLGCPGASSLLPKVKKLAQEINDAGIPTKYTEEINKYIWAKLLYNAALNPLSTLLESPYGYLSENEETRFLMKRIVEECFAVAKAENTPLFWEKSEDYFAVLMGRLIPSTAEHHPSMLQDIRKGKKTEIDAINGAIVERAKSLGVSTPVNEVVTLLIHALEKKEKA